MKRRYNRQKNIKKVAVLLAAVILTLLFIAGIDKRLRIVVSQVARHNAKDYSVTVINNCIEQLLMSGDFEYNNLISIEKGDESVPSVLRTNVTAINTLKARLTAGIQEKLKDYTIHTVYIAAGTLTGNDLFTGRGPKIAVKIIPLGHVTTELKNEFTQAGINQTLYRIMLTVKANVSVVAPGYSSQTSVETDFCVAETLIVGAVPDAYTQVNEAQDKISSIYDFGADAKK